MAKVKISVPFLVRELVSELEQATGLRLGVPMTAEVPSAGEEETRGVARCHFPGRISFRCDVRTGTGHYGQYLLIERISCRAKRGLAQELEMGPGWQVTSCEIQPRTEIDEDIVLIGFVGEREQALT